MEFMLMDTHTFIFRLAWSYVISDQLSIELCTYIKHIKSIPSVMNNIIIGAILQLVWDHIIIFNEQVKEFSFDWDVYYIIYIALFDK